MAHSNPPKGGDAVGLTGKGSRLMLATDANDLPLGILTMSAGVGEVRMADRADLRVVGTPAALVRAA
jgi:hypothetical protein